MIDTRSPDSFEWRFVLVALGILALGVISIYSVSPITTPKGQTPLYAKQLTSILIGLVAFLAAVAIDYHKLARHAYILYGLTLVLLALVLVTGRVSRGAQRWFAVGPVVFQPSEVAKLVLVLVLSKYFADVQRFGWIQRVIVPGLITLPGLLLILKQPDLGTAMSFTFIFVTMVLVGWPARQGPRRGHAEPAQVPARRPYGLRLRGVRRAMGLHRSPRALRALRDLDLPGLGDRLQGQGPAGAALGDRYPVDGGLLPDGQRGHDDGDLPDRRHPAPADELRRDHHRDLHGGPGALAECETTSVDTVLLIKFTWEGPRRRPSHTYVG